MIKKVKIEITQLTCDLCGHQWELKRTKTALPKGCSSCGSPRWNDGRKRPPIAEQRAKAHEAEKSPNDS